MRPLANGGIHGALRLEGLVLFSAAVLGYAWTGASWWLFGLLFLTPDIGVLGYLMGPQIGAAVYNGTHTTLGPALLGGAGALLDIPLALSLAAIWAAHFGFDRLLGYGLKYATAFNDTHLGPLANGAATGAPEVERSSRRRRICGA